MNKEEGDIAPNYFRERLDRWTNWMTTTQSGRTAVGTLLALMTSFLVVPVNIMSGQIVKEINVSSYAFLRFSSISLLLLPLVVCRHESLKLSTYSIQEWIAMVISGMSRAAALLTFNYALYYINVFDMTVFAALKPVMVALFLCCVPEENPDLFDIIPLFLSIVGSLFIAQPPAIFKSISLSTLYSVPVVAFLYAISSPAFYAVNNIICRKFRKIPLLLSVFMQTFCGIPLTLLLMFAIEEFEFPATRTCIYQLVSVNILYIGRVTSHTYALYFISSVQVSVLDSFRIPLTLLANYVLFKILPNWLKGVGSAIVIVAVLLYLFKVKIVELCSKLYNKIRNVQDDETTLLITN